MNRYIRFFNLTVLTYITLLIALCFWFSKMSMGIDNSVLGLYHFRQAQTAITSYWMIAEGFRLDYITPVLGPNWSIPFEFPVYQAVVAGLVNLFGGSIDVTGRIVNILFFLSSLIPLYGFLSSRGLSRKEIVIPVVLLLLSPFYLYWSRTFMIESTTVFFGLVSLYFYERHLKSLDKKLLIFACFFGVIAALTKVTSYSVFLAFMCCITLESMWLKKENLIAISKVAVSGLAIFFIPVSIAIVWNEFADYQKSLNPLATFILSDNLSTWNFGTLEKKLSLDTWLKFIKYIELIVGNIAFCLIGFFAFSNKNLRVLASACLVAFLSGPLVFTNLYFVHEYYFYANGFFILLFIALGIISLFKERKSLLSLGFCIVLCITFLYVYEKTYPKMVKHESQHPMNRVAKAIKNNTNPEDIIIIFGADWNSSIPYYAERKAIMERSNRALSNEDFQKSIQGQTIGAVVFCKMRQKSFSKEFIKERTDYFSVESAPLSVWVCDMHFKKTLIVDKTTI